MSATGRRGIIIYYTAISHDMVIITFDRNLRITNWNPAAEKIFGWSRNEAIGEPISILARDSRELNGLTKRTLKGDFVPGLKLNAVDKLGRQHKVRIWSSLLVNQKDVPEGCLVIMNNTEQPLLDELTGFYKRYYMKRILQRYKDRLPISIIICDFNGLRMINSSYGYEAGNMALIEMARALKEFCREGDIISRWGGDEFLILLPGTSEKEAAKLAGKMERECENRDTRFSLSISLGYATKKEPDQDLDEIICSAETWMLRHKLRENRSIRGGVITLLLQVLHEKSDETTEHVQRLQKAALKVGAELGLSSRDMDRLFLLMVLHDIGKVAVPESILRKPEQLKREEWEQIKLHPEVGYRIACSFEDFSDVAEEILAHHEHWDGRGYPRGLKGEEIPFLARIAAILDAYDVMTNYRSYKEPISRKKAIDEIIGNAGRQFDPELVGVVVQLLEENEL